MKEQRLGIVTSLAIHAGLLVLFFTIPVTNVNPYSNTIFLSFRSRGGINFNKSEGNETDNPI